MGTRWEAEDALGLYRLPGRVFVELRYDTRAHCLVRLRAFLGSETLEDFAPPAPFPEGLPALTRW